MMRLFVFLLVATFQTHAYAGGWVIDGFKLGDKYENIKAELNTCSMTQIYTSFKGERIAESGLDFNCFKDGAKVNIMFDHHLKLMLLRKTFKYTVGADYKSIFIQHLNQFGEPDVKAKTIITDASNPTGYMFAPKWTFAEYACWGDLCEYSSVTSIPGTTAINGGRAVVPLKGKTVLSQFMDLKEDGFTFSLQITMRDGDAFELSQFNSKVEKSNYKKGLNK
jgi:hypothetical protein